MTDGSLSIESTAIAALPFSNSIGFQPDRMKNTTEPLGWALHQGKTRCFDSTRIRLPSPAFDHDRTERMKVESLSSSFCSSSRAITLTRRSSVGLPPDLGSG